MNIVSAIAIYFIVWWTVLFAVLPFGVRNAHETGNTVSEGNDAGAPMAPLLFKKVIATTLISAILFGAFLLILRSGTVTLDDLSFFTLPQS